MYPKPPLLLEGKGVTDDEPGESYWKIFNGFRLTGMPGFSKSLSETQMWQMSLLVANADKLPACGESGAGRVPSGERVRQPMYRQCRLCQLRRLLPAGKIATEEFRDARLSRSDSVSANRRASSRAIV